MTLMKSTEYEADKITNNIAKLNAMVDTADVELGKYVAAAGAPDAAISLGTGVSKDVKYSGAIKNLTSETMGVEALSFVSVTWTIAADTIPAP